MKPGHYFVGRRWDGPMRANREERISLTQEELKALATPGGWEWAYLTVEDGAALFTMRLNAQAKLRRLAGIELEGLTDG